MGDGRLIQHNKRWGRYGRFVLACIVICPWIGLTVQASAESRRYVHHRKNLGLHIHGISDGQTVTEDPVIYAALAGETNAVNFLLYGPKGEIMSVSRASQPYALVKAEEGGKALPLNISRLEAGSYTLYASSVHKAPGSRYQSLAFASVQFSIIPDQAKGRLVRYDGAPEVQMVASAEEPAVFAEESVATVEEKSIVTANKESLTQPIEVPAASAIPFDLAFDEKAVPKHILGASTAVPLVSTGEQPSDAKVVALAWSVANQEMVGNFAHELEGPAYEISADWMDRLPAGDVQLQVLINQPGKLQVKRTHQIEILAAPDPVDMFAVKFSAGAPSVHTLGDAGTIALDISGQLPVAGKVVVIAWSRTTQSIVDGFNVALTGGPYAIDQRHLDRLPVGEHQLQVLVIVPGEVPVKSTHWIEVVLPEPESEPELDPEFVGFAETAPVSEPAPAPEPAPVVSNDAFSLSFASDAVSSHIYGENKSILLEVTGDRPTDANVVVLAWSAEGQAMVEAFAHPLPGPGYVITGARLDMLPEGRNQLQVLVLVPGQPDIKLTHSIDVNSAPEPEPTPVLDVVVEPDQSLELADDGFTAFEKSNDTRVIYVSASEGSDNNHGLSQDFPIKSPGKGYELLRDGYPDWLLFKAGDTFHDEIGRWQKSGRSADEKMLVGVYGDGPRPMFICDGTFINVFGDPESHIALVGLDLYAAVRDPANGVGYRDHMKGFGGIRWVTSGEDLLIEDCRMRYFSKGLVIAPPPGGSFDGITIRRNIITYNWSDSDRGAGVFTNRVSHILVEQNVLDHNGHHPVASREYRRGTQAHNVYFDNDAPVKTPAHRITFRGNLVARASAHGAQFRPGGVVEDNVFTHNPLAMYTGDQASEVRRNAVLAGVDIGDMPRGAGIDVVSSDAMLEDNVVAHRASAQGDMHAYYTEAGQNITLRNNVTVGWPGGGQDLPYTFEKATGQVVVAGHRDNASTMVDPSRDIEVYFTHLDQTGDVEDFLEYVSQRPRSIWWQDYCPIKISRWIRAGYDPPPYD